MDKLELLREMINEEGYPYFEDQYLQERVNQINKEITIESIAKELCLVKSGIEEIKLGDVVIPSPKEHFLRLASQYRKNNTGVVVRADER